MRYMMIVKASANSEAGAMPEEAMLAAMGAYNEEMVKAGVLLDAAGLKPTAQGARIRFAKDGTRSVVDGPFTETKELIAGYWIIQVKSREEAIAWALRCPNPHGEGAETYVELRPFFELEDFAPSDAVERMRDVGFAPQP